MEAGTSTREDECGDRTQTPKAMKEIRPDSDKHKETVGSICHEKRKKRRGKSKRKVTKPYVKISPHDCSNKYCEKGLRQLKLNQRSIARQSQTKSHAPYNNNQFLMEVHMPESENIFYPRTPSARTRNSSFSVDSDENYFYSLPEDEEDFLTREFSSVYEDAQSERLSNMSKSELIHEYLDLETKFQTLAKRCGLTPSTKIFGSSDENDENQRNTLNTLLAKIQEQKIEICDLKAKNAALSKSVNLDSSVCDCSSECDSSSTNSVAVQNCSRDSVGLLNQADEAILIDIERTTKYGVSDNTFSECTKSEIKQQSLCASETGH